ncbi:hypothetical protein CY34DRAFT_10642 [Suillus luteus UH-Slu-Lm8-n1]|uniref:Uncharacterized protein n=1 Tax=Suillus luteus UH-Slu-Lm8-n1 TaxID=930992 RepID=A0A0D0BPJ3_9AGAM|nr:hypothetical protein CY34DRAFT_10642 [Suillus luteus UH-Slu-Lm8-n1]
MIVHHNPDALNLDYDSDDFLQVDSENEQVNNHHTPARLHRALSSTLATSFRPPTPDSPLDTSRSQEQTMPTSFTPPGTPPMTSPAPQDGSSSEAIPTFALTTPLRRLSIPYFGTPQPAGEPSVDWVEGVTIMIAVLIVVVVGSSSKRLAKGATIQGPK